MARGIVLIAGERLFQPCHGPLIYWLVVDRMSYKYAATRLSCRKRLWCQPYELFLPQHLTRFGRTDWVTD